MKTEPVISPLDDPPHWGLIAAIVAFVCLLSIAASAAPRPGESVAVVFAPWHDQNTVFRRVVEQGHTPVGLGAVPGVILVAGPADDTLRQLRAAGAWLFLDASFAAALCLDR